MENKKIEKILTFLSKDMMEKVLQKIYTGEDMPKESIFIRDSLNLLLFVHEYCWGSQEARRVSKIMDDVMAGKRSVPKNRYEEAN